MSPESHTAGHVEIVIEEARTLVGEGRLGDAFELLHETHEVHGEHAALLCWLGAVARDLDAHGPAYEFFRRCLALNPTDPVVLTTAGAGLARFDDPDAETALRSAAVMAPELPVTRLNYGSYLAREGQLELANEELSAARDLQPDDPIAWIELGYAAFVAQEREGAAEALDRACEILPDDGWSLGTLALLQWWAGSEEDALLTAARARGVSPSDPEVAAFAALAHAASGDPDEAEVLLAEMEVMPEADAVLGPYGTEVEDAVGTGPDAARGMLRDIVPTMIRDRYSLRG